MDLYPRIFTYLFIHSFRRHYFSQIPSAVLLFFSLFTSSAVDLIHDTHHLSMRFKIDWIKPTSRGISGGKQPGSEYANHGQFLFILSKGDNDVNHVNVKLDFRKVAPHVQCEDIYSSYCIQKRNIMIIVVSLPTIFIYDDAFSLSR